MSVPSSVGRRYSDPGGTGATALVGVDRAVEECLDEVGRGDRQMEALGALA